ncbi:uncharacterized protein LOC143020818 [Oratosquilla oratoria]|uniref:uncharacterized protein LOC143020818 n=1 Tax=Oratosquilla oratoria TaxID=337810 RepID=UPI003F75A310
MDLCKDASHLDLGFYAYRDKKYTQRYRSAWESDQRFKGWLQPYPGDRTRARCKICGAGFQAHLKSIIGHSSGKKHLENMKSSASKIQATVDTIFQPLENYPTKIAELKLAVYVTEHASDQSVDNLSEVISQLDNKSEVLQKINLHRSKCSRLQKYVIAPSFSKTLRNDISDHFSLFADEITNEGNLSCLALTIRYFSESKKRMVDTFYRLVPLRDSKAGDIYVTVKNCLMEDGLDVNKLMGIGTDGANLMVIHHHSLVTLLKNDNPEIILIRCVCHSLHLSASKACENLPTVLEFLVKETHTWFSKSPKRINKYTNLYKVLEDRVPKKVDGLASVRWLSRLDAIGVILDQWDSLKRHFEICQTSERCYITEQLSQAYKDPRNKLYLLYLRKVLKEVMRVNKLFQGQKVEVTILTEDFIDMYRNIMHMVIESCHLSKCAKENLPYLEFQNYILPLNEINFGYEFNTFAESCGSTSKELVCIKEKCRQFVLELINQVQLRLPGNVDALFLLQKLHPSVATSQSKGSIANIASRYRSVVRDIDELENEWDVLHLEQWPKSCLESSIGFWAEVYEKLDSAGNRKFPNISAFALALLSLPFSNANVERIFSDIMNIVHSKVRNGFSVRSAEAVLQIRYGLSLQGVTCVDFIPPEDMIRNFLAKAEEETQDNKDIVSLEVGIH